MAKHGSETFIARVKVFCLGERFEAMQRNSTSTHARVYKVTDVHRWYKMTRSELHPKLCLFRCGISVSFGSVCRPSACFDELLPGRLFTSYTKPPKIPWFVCFSRITTTFLGALCYIMHVRLVCRCTRTSGSTNVGTVLGTHV